MHTHMHVWLCVYVCVCDAITAACCVAFHHLRGLPLMVRPWGEGGEEEEEGEEEKVKMANSKR
jgi:hypothetical protein